MTLGLARVRLRNDYRRIIPGQTLTLYSARSTLPPSSTAPVDFNIWQGGTAAKASARHIVKVAQKSAKVVFENDLVRVIETTQRIKSKKNPVEYN